MSRVGPEWRLNFAKYREESFKIFFSKSNEPEKL